MIIGFIVGSVVSSAFWIWRAKVYIESVRRAYEPIRKNANRARR